MTRPPGVPEEPFVPLNDPAVRLVRDLIHDRTGSFFADDRLGSMLDKLEPRIAATRSRTLLDYYYLLKYDSAGDREWRRVLDSFAVQETYFWREADQIRALVNHVVPEWFGRTALPLRIWSSACATGEEPYSLVMALLEAGWGSHPIEIVGSDASETALERAQAGLYRDRSFRALAPELRQKYFEPHADGARIHSSVRERVKFRWANLVSLPDEQELGSFPVIFCRNVFIYFSAEAITRVVRSFSQRQALGNWLFVGASESLLRLTVHYDLQEQAGAFVYRRNATP